MGTTTFSGPIKGTSDLPIYIDFSAGSSGAGYVTVEYIQNINNA
jgi:hypothetical protein